MTGDGGWRVLVAAVAVPEQNGRRAPRDYYYRDYYYDYDYYNPSGGDSDVPAGRSARPQADYRRCRVMTAYAVFYYVTQPPRRFDSTPRDIRAYFGFHLRRSRMNKRRARGPNHQVRSSDDVENAICASNECFPPGKLFDTQSIETNSRRFNSTVTFGSSIRIATTRISSVSVRPTERFACLGTSGVILGGLDGRSPLL